MVTNSCSRPRQRGTSAAIRSRTSARISMSSLMKARLAIIALAGTAGSLAGAEDLRGPETFASITNQSERSRALFVEAGRVLQHPRRHGGKTPAAIHEHMAHDSLVGWGWMPGANREPAPGTQAQLGALIAAWIESGAACPRSEEH